MSETGSRRTLRDFLGLPNGREEYVKFMVAYEAAEDPDTRFTQQENEELFGLQFDLAAKLRELDRKLISQEDFDAYKAGHDQRVDEIVATSRARNAAAKEAWEVHDRAEMMMGLGQNTPNAKQLEAASLSIDDEQNRVAEVKKTLAEVQEHIGRLEQSVDAMQVLTEHITGKDMSAAEAGTVDPVRAAREKEREQLGLNWRDTLPSDLTLPPRPENVIKEAKLVNNTPELDKPPGRFQQIITTIKKSFAKWM
jgi:fructose-specific component phosphotransferase system IIB-like protein